MNATTQAVELARLAAAAAVAKKAEDPIAFDVSQRLVITDVFLILTANNERQVKAVADAVEEAMLAIGRKISGREGGQVNRWVLLDFQELVVHVQHREERSLYALDKLWKDCPPVDLGILDVVDQGQ